VKNGFANRRRIAADAVAVIASVAGASALIALLDSLAPVVGLSSIYLLAVLFVAIRRGLGAAVVTAVLAALVFNFFFLRPRYQLTIAESRDVAALIVMLIAALVVGRLAATSRARAEEAEDRAQLAAARQREAMIIARAASSLLEGRELDPQLARIGEAVNATSGGALRLAFSSAPSHGPGESAVPLPSEGRAAWLYATAATGWRPADVERLATSLARLVDLAVDRSRSNARAAEAEAARRADVAKTAVLHAISHDLRSPLTAIRTASEGLAAGGLDPEDERGLLAAIEEESERLTGLVDDLLDLSRIQADAVGPRSDWCDLGDVAATAAAQVRRRRGDHPISIELPPDLPLIRADPSQLERVLANLIENAVKFSPPHEPVRVTGGAGARKVTVRVIDRGPGIPASQRAAVFEPFFRGRRGDNRGSGLGLAICRGFVEANGGELALQADTGLGTAFAVSFPLAEQPAPVPR
jgi:two-component system, OmpR family, sensor histidine kinase KdpD